MILKCCFYRRALFAIFFCTQLSDAFALKKTGTTLRPLNVCLVNISRFERKCLYATEKDDSMDDGINDSLTSDGDDFLTRVRIRNIDPAGIRNNFKIFGKPVFLSS